MASFDLIMPKMGESVAEATIIKWTKKEGDKVKIDETVLEIATDKVDSEIPSPFEGTLVKCLFKEGDVVQVGAVIGVIKSETGASEEESPKTASPDTKKTETASTTSTAAAAPASSSKSDYGQSEKFYSPLVKSI